MWQYKWNEVFYIGKRHGCHQNHKFWKVWRLSKHFFWKKSKVFGPIRASTGNHLGFRIIPKKYKVHFFRIPEKHLLQDWWLQMKQFWRKKRKKMFQTIRGWGDHAGKKSLKKTQYFLLTLRGKFLASRLSSRAEVLEKNSRMSWQIRGQDSHLEFLNF